KVKVTKIHNCKLATGDVSVKSLAGVLASLKTLRVVALMHVKTFEVLSSRVDVVWKFGYRGSCSGVVPVI
ncbi:hypothetical protein TNCV_3496131, partial [Trichonephila clavipes]